MVKSIVETKYKDKSPKETINSIKNTILDLGFDIEEKEYDSGVGTFWSRVLVYYRGERIAYSGGKGNTPEFAMASAYGEIMERLECHFSVIYRQFQSLYNKDILGLDEFVIYPDEYKEYDLDKYYLNDNILKYVLEKCNEDNKECINKFNKYIYQSYGYIPLVDFYSVQKKENVKVNEILARHLVGTTGYASGNSKYEALLQGLCEIIERFSKFLIYKDNICLPIIPDDVLKNYEYVYETYKMVNSSDRFSLEIRDASLGKDLPVICAILYDRQKRGYVADFGAFPDFTIALERSVNELFQYYDIEDVRSIREYNCYDVENLKRDMFNRGFERFSKYKESVDYHWYDSSNATNEALYKDRFIGEDFDYEFKEWDKSLVGKSNKELFKYLCKVIKENFDDDVLYHDCSYLGFPAYSIICPKISFKGYVHFNGCYQTNLVDRLFVEENIFGKGEVDKKTVEEKVNYNDINANLDYILGRPLIVKDGTSEYFYLGYLEFVKGNYVKAATYMSLSYPDYAGEDNPDLVYRYWDIRNCLVSFIGLKQTIKDDKKIKKMLKKMYDHAIVDYIGSVCEDADSLVEALFLDKNSKVCVVDWYNFNIVKDAFRILWDKKAQVYRERK